MAGVFLAAVTDGVFLVAGVFCEAAGVPEAVLGGLQVPSFQVLAKIGRKKWAMRQ